MGAMPWLQAVRACTGENMVFALDEALMCQGSLGGHRDEFIVWVYGNDSVSCLNGVVVPGNQISSSNVKEKDGLRYTNFNRTTADVLANESIPDMQGITEAVSQYYYCNGNSLEGIFAAPEYQERFERLADEAIAYSENGGVFPDWNLTAEENRMQKVMKGIHDSGIPVGFKGSMVLKAGLMEAGYSEETRHTADIDEKCISKMCCPQRMMGDRKQKQTDKIFCSADSAGRFSFLKISRLFLCAPGERTF